MTGRAVGKLGKYLILTFGITWALWWGDALLVKVTPMKESDVLPMVLFTLGGLGPTFAACLCLEGGFSWKKLWTFLSAHKKGKVWYLFLFAALEFALFFFSSDGLLDTIPRSPAAVAVFLVVFLQAATLFGGNEELGWRGTMQPILLKKVSSWASPLIIGVIWVCWHVPLWFIEGNTHQSMSFVSFAVLGIALSYWLSAIYDVTGSVLCCMALHGLTNTLMGLFQVNEGYPYTVGMVILTLIAICASLKAAETPMTQS